MCLVFMDQTVRISIKKTESVVSPLMTLTELMDSASSSFSVESVNCWFTSTEQTEGHSGSDLIFTLDMQFNGDFALSEASLLSHSL